jgi:hypothetical protein
VESEGERMKKSGTALHDIKIHVKIKLSALWASVMFCYIYGDYFGLFQPRQLRAMLEGKIPPLGAVTQGVLVGTSLMMVIPSVMVFLSLALKADLNRWVNIILGVVYSGIILITMPGSWAFYIFLGVVEVVLTALVVGYAWNWPKQEAI